MIIIPNNVVYFVLGFITCFIIIIIYVIHLIHKEEDKKKEIMKSYMEIMAHADKEEQNKGEE